MNIKPGIFDSASKEGNVFRSQVVLLIDVSHSMGAAERIRELEEAVTKFLAEDLEATGMFNRGELAIGAFNSSVEWLTLGPTPTRTGSNFYRMNAVTGLTNSLIAAGSTRMADAIRAAVELIDERARQIPNENLAREHKPQIFLITDGCPDRDQDMEAVATLLHARALYEESADLLFFALGVEGADMEILRRLAPQSHYNVALHPLRDLLRWVSESVNESINANSRPRSPASPTRPYSPEYERVSSSINTGIFAKIQQKNATSLDG